MSFLLSCFRCLGGPHADAIRAITSHENTPHTLLSTKNFTMNFVVVKTHRRQDTLASFEGVLYGVYSNAENDTRLNDMIDAFVDAIVVKTHRRTSAITSYEGIYMDRHAESRQDSPIRARPSIHEYGRTTHEQSEAIRLTSETTLLPPHFSRVDEISPHMDKDGTQRKANIDCREHIPPTKLRAVCKLGQLQTHDKGAAAND